MKNKNREKIHINPTFSKAQIEVWEMKDKIYESVKHLNLDDALHQIMESSHQLTEQFIKEHNIKTNG